MSAPFAFPANPSSFIAMSGPTKTRVFLMAQPTPHASSAQLEQVVTLAVPAEEAAAIVEALNTAAWSGDERPLTAALASLPDAVVQSCRQALEKCPAPDDLVLGEEGRPMRTVQHLYFGMNHSELVTAASAAYDIGLQCVVRNGLGDHGFAEFEARILDDECEIDPEEAESWWTVPEGIRVLERFSPAPDELGDAFLDERWETYVGRAYWLLVRDRAADSDPERGWTATAEWFVEFWDLPLEPERNISVFIADDLSDEDRGVITPRTRFLLWQAFSNMAVDLDSMLSEPESIDDPIVKGDLPDMVQDQPEEWWVKLRESAERLCEAARRAKLDELVPRTPAEEALIYLASTHEYVEWARDNLEMSTYQQQYDRLPRCEDDEFWEEVLGGLTGDIDIEMMWNADLARIADPADLTNQILRMGDYRPQAWHDLFTRAREDLGAS